MAMQIYENTLVIKLPNSEATLNAQHKGIADRTVGSYYLSEKSNEILPFLNNLEGTFYLDLLRTKFNLEPMINKLDEIGLNSSFKRELVPQVDAIKVISNLLKKGETLYKIDNPTLNDRGKYLKFPLDNVVTEFKDICLGDLTLIKIKKLEKSCFVIYGEMVPDFEEKLNNNTILKWG